MFAAALILLAAADAGYLHELQASARAQHLAGAPGWLKLLHSDKGGHSEATRAFFLSPGGAADPEAELSADLEGFFAGTAQCQFPARLAWLNGQLHFDFNRLQLQACPKFEEFYQRVSARAVTAVFSSYYLSSPASAFGHTLLRLDKADTALSGKHFELLDYGLNYAATVDTQNALLYAFKGLFGLFPGQFTAMPYFYKVREYNDFESRDLWEYDLALTPAQVAMLAAHAWELGSTEFPYYYISKNCSYHLIAALDAAAPELDLLRQLGHIAVPADTIKALDSHPGLVREVRYRPSIRAQFRERVKGLSGPERDEVAALAADPLAPLPDALPEPGRAQILDAALDLVDMRYARGLILGTDPAAMKLKQALLERRSAVRVPSEPLPIAPPSLQAPQLGHGSMRAGAGAGGSTRAGPFATADLRLALHDLLDPPAGYPELAQLEFVDLRLRYNARAGSLWLEEAWLANVATLSPVDRFTQPVSWRMRVGAETLRDRGCAGCLAASADLAGGGSLGFFDDRLAIFAMAGSALAASPHLDGLGGKAVRLGLGPYGGARLRLGSTLVLLASGRWLALPFTALHSTWDAELSARAALPKGFSLGATVRQTQDFTEASAGAFYYF